MLSLSMDIHPMNFKRYLFDSTAKGVCNMNMYILKVNVIYSNPKNKEYVYYHI